MAIINIEYTLYIYKGQYKYLGIKLCALAMFTTQPLT